MANRIDRFIDAMHRKKAQKLLFETGKPVRIVVGTTTRVILDKAVRADQIDKLVVPVLEVEEGARFTTEPSGVYRYESNNGTVTIDSKRKGTWISVEIRPAGNTGEMPLFDDEVPEKAALERPASLAPKEAPREPKPLTRSFRMVGRATGEGPMIDKILTQLAEAGGSDLHLTTGQRPKMRNDGEIVDMPGWNDVLTSEDVQSWMLDVAAKRIQEEYLETHDADYAHEVKGIARFRMNIFRDRNGTGAVIRTIPSEILTAEQLGLPEACKQFCHLNKGLVCVTGPTGSGKSTTLAAMIDSINKSRPDHIITIEDPVEFVHQSHKCLINQREVHTHTESFSRALRAALREDPDIVLVGEMRDLETVHIAIETAETGHLVFGTLHTNTAISTVDRIIDQFPTDRQAQIRVMLSETLKGVIAQVLCKKVGGGRTAILEILVVTAAIANLIREGKTFQISSLMQTGKKLGMETQKTAFMRKVEDGLITPLEAVTKAADPGAMRSALLAANYNIEEAAEPEH